MQRSIEAVCFESGLVRIRILTVLLALARITFASQDRVPAFTFASNPECLYVSARAASEALNIPYSYDARSDLVFLGSIPLDYESAVGSERFVAIELLKAIGAVVTADQGSMSVTLNGHAMKVHGGKKRAVLDKTSQMFRAYQGGSLVLTSRMSTGKYSRSTPVGTFRVGYLKDAYKSSSKYGDAPMPYAVHVTRNVFIHGGVVPNYPASHGCVRLPDDAAKWFFNWAEPGTMLTIRG